MHREFPGIDRKSLRHDLGNGAPSEWMSLWVALSWKRSSSSSFATFRSMEGSSVHCMYVIIICIKARCGYGVVLRQIVLLACCFSALFMRILKWFWDQKATIVRVYEFVCTCCFLWIVYENFKDYFETKRPLSYEITILHAVFATSHFIERDVRWWNVPFGFPCPTLKQRCTILIIEVRIIIIYFDF
jgi:hypothetical protein